MASRLRAEDVSFDASDVPQDYPYSLATIYLITFGVVALLYPGCAWSRRSTPRKSAWLVYM